MNFENIQQKNIKGLDFFGEVVPEGIARFESSLQDLFLLAEDEELQAFENQFDEYKNKKVILAKLPEESKKKNNKSPYFKAMLQEDIDAENIKKIESIRYYTDQQRDTYIQIIFEMT